jgi:(p)ppGpp synthase/HD superfamily hydrolase
MKKDDILYHVQEYARKAHGSQRRKFADEAYIEHPIRVMKTCSTVTGEVSILAAALLHDVLEDTPVTRDEMRDFLGLVMPTGIAERTLFLVVELTDMYTHQAYPKWNRRVRKEKEFARLAATSADAQTIKYADIIDNAKDIIGSGDDFSRKFLLECSTNLRTLNKGHAGLYEQAVRLVSEYLGKLERES